jgi:hypothetical protein
VTTCSLSDTDLDTLRTIADPALEREPILGPGYFQSVAESGVVAALTGDARNRMDDLGADALSRWRKDAPKRFCVDEKDLWPHIEKARCLFETHGDEIAAALLLAGLPELYATQWGAPVLVAHGDLIWNVRRRVRQTAQFLLDVLSQEYPKPDEPAGVDPLEQRTLRLVSAALAVRYFHHQLRVQLLRDPQALGSENSGENQPLNQEDLLGTLLTFTVTVFRVFGLFGVEITADQQKAYLMLWDLVGELMGIGDEIAEDEARQKGIYLGPRPWSVEQPEARTPDLDLHLRPSSVDGAVSLLEKLHSRQWRPVPRTLEDCDPVPQGDDDDVAEDDNNVGLLLPSDPLNAGRILTRALLDELTDAMPPRRRRLPLDVMRALAPHDVRTRLGLVGGGLVDYAWRRLPGRRWRANQWTSFETPNRVGATMLRLAATDVNRNAIIAFLKSDGPPFVFPNLDFGEEGLLPRNPPTGPSFLALIRQEGDLY